MAYKQSLDNGVLKKPSDVSDNSGTFRNGNWEDILASGENPKGFTAVTPNGISRVSSGITGCSNNYGKREDGDHYDWASEIAPALPRR